MLKEKTVENMAGSMDQEMIDALLSGAGAGSEEKEEVSGSAAGPMDQEMIDALLSGAGAGTEVEEVAQLQEEGFDGIDELALAMEVESNKVEESAAVLEEEPVSMLAQLMAEMQEEASEVVEDAFDGISLMSEDSIDALLDAAKDTSSSAVTETISNETPVADDIAEIEALLGMSDSGEVLDENAALLQMLEEAGSFTPEVEEVREMDVSELDSLLSANSAEAKESSEEEETLVKEEKEKKEKKPLKMKDFFGKILSVLVEEVPEETVADKDRLNLSDENKEILEELDKEDSKKIKAKEKKAKIEKKQQEKKAKKEEKAKIAQERKLKRTLNKKDKPVVKPDSKEKKLPRKRVIVTFAFAFSVLAAILVVVIVVPSVLSLGRARSAFDKGEYLAAYKEYYGQKLPEEDEKKFQAATTVLQMKSNLDGYHNYLKLGNEMYALHSLLEGVHVRDEVFGKAQEFDILSEVSKIYNEILGLLSGEYQLSEEEALELVKEESDVTYTKKLQALTEGTKVEVMKETTEEVSQDNLLPEEEELFIDGN